MYYSIFRILLFEEVLIMNLFFNYIKKAFEAACFFFNHFGDSLRSDSYAKGFDDKGIAQDVHEISKKMVEDYFVPGHDPRSNSDVYNATHKKMCITEDMPCYICGVKNSTLSDPAQNLHGSKQLETHHFNLEWSLANAADWDVLKAMHPDFTDWAKVVPADPSTYKYFVDSEYNMMVLCDIHHRATYRGIHAIEYPVWSAQKYMKKDFKFINVNTKDLPELLDDMS